jgi:hypothetical protein
MIATLKADLRRVNPAIEDILKSAEEPSAPPGQPNPESREIICSIETLRKLRSRTTHVKD